MCLESYVWAVKRIMRCFVNVRARETGSDGSGGRGLCAAHCVACMNQVR